MRPCGSIPARPEDEYRSDVIDTAQSCQRKTVAGTGITADLSAIGCRRFEDFSFTPANELFSDPAKGQGRHKFANFAVPFAHLGFLRFELIEQGATPTQDLTRTLSPILKLETRNLKLIYLVAVSAARFSPICLISAFCGSANFAVPSRIRVSSIFFGSTFWSISFSTASGGI